MNIKELRVGKGTTVEKAGHWEKVYYELLIHTEDLSEDQVEDYRRTAAAYLDKLLEPIHVQPYPEVHPSVAHPEPFDPEELMQHAWKGKKTSTGYAQGSLEWGWDFADQFSPEAIAALPMVIGGYQFILSDNQKIVSVAKTP